MELDFFNLYGLSLYVLAGVPHVFYVKTMVRSVFFELLHDL